MGWSENQVNGLEMLIKLVNCFRRFFKQVGWEDRWLCPENSQCAVIRNDETREQTLSEFRIDLLYR